MHSDARSRILFTGDLDLVQHVAHAAVMPGELALVLLDAFAARGSATLDDAAREKIWHEAIARYADEEPLIQLVQYLNTWGLRKGLRHEPRMDERTLAMGVRPAP